VIPLSSSQRPRAACRFFPRKRAAGVGRRCILAANWVYPYWELRVPMLQKGVAGDAGRTLLLCLAGRTTWNVAANTAPIAG
jgi:hypothetical protein